LQLIQVTLDSSGRRPDEAAFPDLDSQQVSQSRKRMCRAAAPVRRGAVARRRRRAKLIASRPGRCLFFLSSSSGQSAHLSRGSSAVAEVVCVPRPFLIAWRAVCMDAVRVAPGSCCLAVCRGTVQDGNEVRAAALPVLRLVATVTLLQLGAISKAALWLPYAAEPLACITVDNLLCIARAACQPSVWDYICRAAAVICSRSRRASPPSRALCSHHPSATPH